MTPASIGTGQLYRGVIPFVVLQLIAITALFLFPGLATWLPGVVFGN